MVDGLSYFCTLFLNLDLGGCGYMQYKFGRIDDSLFVKETQCLCVVPLYEGRDKLFS
jgi:hypothetical protein